MNNNFLIHFEDNAYKVIFFPKVFTPIFAGNIFQFANY